MYGTTFTTHLENKSSSADGDCVKCSYTKSLWMLTTQIYRKCFQMALSKPEHSVTTAISLAAVQGGEYNSETQVK